MAKLKCAHERRVLLIKDACDANVVRHRNDGSACDSRFVAIDKVVYDTSADGLGAVVTIGTLDEAAVRANKKVRKIRKTKR